MPIIQVADNKKLKHLNEGFFDDENFSDLADEVTVNIGDEAQAEIAMAIEEKELRPKAEEWLKKHDILDYDINCTGKGILIDVHDHLMLTSQKLESLPPYIRFNQVDGDCNFSNNRFTNFYYFPRIIMGDLIAGFNYIRSFSGAPQVNGMVYMNRQRTKTRYPLTHENYKKYMKGESLYENRVYSEKLDRYGELKGINEEQGTCKVLFDDDKHITVCENNTIHVLDGVNIIKKVYQQLR